MKTELKEQLRAVNKKSEIIINPELDKYQGQILFPKKLDLAEKQLKGVDLSVIRNYRGK